MWFELQQTKLCDGSVCTGLNELLFAGHAYVTVVYQQSDSGTCLGPVRE